MSKKLSAIVSLFILLFLFSTNNITAQEKPFQLSLFNPVQLFSENTSISALRLNILYGKNVNVTGLDVGLVNHNTGNNSVGLQYGAVGLIEGSFVGWQDNAVNITKKNCKGLQAGFVNYAGKMKGIQFGIVNYAVNMEGLQIGLINIIKHGGQFPFFPIVNWAF